MTKWPPQLDYRATGAHRRLRTWRFSADGPFWGGVLFLVIWGSAVTVIASSIASGTSHP